MSKRWNVSILEVWSADAEVDADTEEEAKEKAEALLANGEVNEGSYSHTLDRKTWTVYEI